MMTPAHRASGVRKAPFEPRRRRGLQGAVLIVALCAAVARAELVSPPPESDPLASLVAQAVAFEHGEGVPKDPPLAAALYCEAARAGNAEAQYALGWMYANGRGVPRDPAVADALFSLAARSGHAYARKMLGGGDGEGLLPDCMAPLEPLVLQPSPFANDPDPLAALSRRHQTIAGMVAKVAPGYGVDPRLALAVIAVESKFEPRARSTKKAQGLMQLIPETAARFNVQNAFDIHDNLRGGLGYLRWLLAYYEGRVELAAAAYNAGEATVDRYRGIPPYPETRDYVKRVLRLFQRDSHPYDSRVVAPSPMLPGRAGASAR
jgi:TPR repeat protein